MSTKEEVLAALEAMSLDELSAIDKRVADESAKAQKLAAFAEFMDANGTAVVGAVVAAVQDRGPQNLPPAAQQAIEDMARQLDAAVKRAEKAEAELAQADTEANK